MIRCVSRHGSGSPRARAFLLLRQRSRLHWWRGAALGAGQGFHRRGGLGRGRGRGWGRRAHRRSPGSRPPAPRSRGLDRRWQLLGARDRGSAGNVILELRPGDGRVGRPLRSVASATRPVLRGGSRPRGRATRLGWLRSGSTSRAPGVARSPSEEAHRWRLVMDRGLQGSRPSTAPPTRPVRPSRSGARGLFEEGGLAARAGEVETGGPPGPIAGGSVSVRTLGRRVRGPGERAARASGRPFGGPGRRTNPPSS